MLLLWGLHRHSVWGPDADQFRPERWLNRSTPPEKSFFSGFGIGKRNCIGRFHSIITGSNAKAVRRIEQIRDHNTGRREDFRMSISGGSHQMSPTYPFRCLPS